MRPLFISNFDRMKQFIINVLKFSLIIALSLFIGEFLVRQVPNPYTTKNEWLSNNGDRISTLILGNSHSFYGVRADLWPDSAFNLSNVSQQISYDKRLLEHYLPSMPNLKTLIIQVSYTTLFDKEPEESDEWWRCINYQIYMHLDKHSFFSKYNYEFSYIPVYASKLANRLGLGKPSLLCDSIGNGLGYTLANRSELWQETGSKIAESHNSCIYTDRLSINLSNILNIADICTSNNIKLIIYTQPNWHTYRDNIDYNHIKNMRKSIGELCTHTGATYLDFYESPDFNERDFFDADHLTYEYGAVKLTKMILDSIASINK